MRVGWLKRSLCAALGTALAGALMATGIGTTSTVAHAAPRSIIVISPHPDDDVLTAAGVVASGLAQGAQVHVVYMTNGDGAAGNSGEDVGVVRQNEAFLAQAALGDPENNLIFLGYPDSNLKDLHDHNYSGKLTTAWGSSRTYGSAGLGGTDYHNYKFGSHADYTAENVVTDLQSILATYRPDDIYTTAESDRHSDHATTFAFVKEAALAAANADHTYAPTVHKTIVWTNDPFTWPAPKDPTAVNVPIPNIGNYGLDWSQRESLTVPAAMQSTNYAQNPKYLAINSHATQGGADAGGSPGSIPVGFLGNFIHKDEVFWTDDLGIAHAPVLGVDTTTLDLGTVTVGQGTASKTVTVTNNGNQPLVVSSAPVSGDAFSVEAAPPVGASINPGATQALKVTFNPKAAGAATGSLKVNSNGGSATVTLKGTGQAVDVKGETASRTGYWMLDASGKAYGFGDAKDLGSAASAMGTPAWGKLAIHLEPTPSGDGYWVVSTQGKVYPFGDAKNLGSANTAVFAPGEYVTSLSATPTGNGYWIFTTRGRVQAFGDAALYGDLTRLTLNGPVTSSIPTPSGHGYYMVGSDGGIFAFGDAVFRGSMGGKRLNAPVQSLVPTGTNLGYWLVASDGGIFAFGDADFRGSMGGKHLNKPVVGMVRFGNGYLMVGADGGIFTFSDKPFLGSLGANPPSYAVTSVASLG
ncbi:MAG: PIG-L family deacetylase [Acidimicrobiia bacterium]